MLDTLSPTVRRDLYSLLSRLKHPGVVLYRKAELVTIFSIKSSAPFSRILLDIRSTRVSLERNYYVLKLTTVHFISSTGPSAKYNLFHKIKVKKIQLLF